MKRLIVKGVTATILVVALAFPPITSAFAANPHSGGTTGRPNQSCGSTTAPNTPGNAANSPGSPFNPSGNAGTHYAGQQPQNSRNGQASQYDVACFQVSQH